MGSLYGLDKAEDYTMYKYSTGLYVQMYYTVHMQAYNCFN